MLPINDPPKHKALYSWELYDVIVNLQLFMLVIVAKVLDIHSCDFVKILLASTLESVICLNVVDTLFTSNTHKIA